MVSLLPGPVEIAAEIRAAFAGPPISHRSDEFIQRFEAVRARLRSMTGAAQAALMVGSGTLANDAVGGQLEGPGLVLVNGEFGARLAAQARRWGLDCRVLEWPWGRAWDLDQVAGSLTQGYPRVDWIWAVHLETSTGMVNDVAGLTALAEQHDVKVCLDCVSSLGSVDLDLSRIWLASGVSGKALGSYAGVAIVFAGNGALKPRPIPAYLDAYEAAEEIGPRFTFPSPALAALECAMEMKREYAPLGCLVRSRLRQMGWQPLVDESLAAPVVTTFDLPEPGFIERCRALGYEIGGESQYLRERGWVQISTMGAVTEAHIQQLFDELACSKSSRAGC